MKHAPATFVLDAAPGRRVIDPATGRDFTRGNVPQSQFWFRRLAAGDVVRVETAAPPAPPPAPATPAPKGK